MGIENEDTRLDIGTTNESRAEELRRSIKNTETEIEEKNLKGEAKIILEERIEEAKKELALLEGSPEEK